MNLQEKYRGCLIGGAVAGNILGARLGLEGIPEKFLTRLELKETVLTVADDLFHAFAEGRREGDWEAKYIRCPDPKA